MIRIFKNFAKDWKYLFTMESAFTSDITKSTKTILQLCGWIIIFSIWWGISATGLIKDSVLPSPINVFASFGDLIVKKHLFTHAGFSVLENLLGYAMAIAIAIPLGFILGMTPGFREMFSKQIDSIRFLPIPAATGIFTALFGLTIWLKVNFLAFGIFVYLLPVVVIRIMEVDKTYKQTIWTLGASKWKQLRMVYFPSVLSRLSDDIRVLVAISWTYIVVAEMMNNTGGLGGLIHIVRQETRYDMLYAIFIVFILIAFLQDKLLLVLDKKVFFRFKYV